MRIIRVVFASLSCLAVACVSFAQGPGESSGCPPYDEPYKTFDARPIVNAIDTNQDGIMTLEEWTDAGAPEGSWNMFMEKDASKKGYITRYEFINETPPNGVDSNCDGYITVWEFLATKNMAPPGGGEGGPGGAPPQK